MACHALPLRLPGLLAAHLCCWLSLLPRTCIDWCFGAKTRAAMFKLTEGGHSTARHQTLHLTGDQLESLQDGHYRLIFSSRYYSCLTNVTLRNSSVDNCRPAFYNYVRFCRQQQIVIPVPRGRIAVLSRAPSNQSSIIGRGCYYDFAEVHEAYRHCHARAVKQTDRHHHHRRCRENRCHRRFCSSLRRWYLRCLLVGITLFPLNC